MSERCWADPLTRKERAVLADKLARSCKRFYGASLQSASWSPAVDARLAASAEMSELHLDVTERAA